MKPEDVEAYDVRPPNGLSARDRDMALRGFVPVVTPDGVTYMRAAGDTQTIGGPGRAGSRPDLLTKEREDQQWVVSERGDYMGPDGKPVSVLVPGPGMLAKRATDLEKRQAAYQTKKAANEADFEQRRAHRLALAQLAGGSQNINSGNRWMAEALLAMPKEERDASMRYMLPGGDRAAMVDARNMDNANEVIKRYMTAGAAGMMNTPATAMAIQQQRIAQRKEMIEWAEKNINDRYAYDANKWGASTFDTNERGQAIQDLMDQYGEPDGPLNLADATRIVDNIGSRKRQPTAPPGGGEPAVAPGSVPPI
jgi:hypothetical protein